MNRQRMGMVIRARPEKLETYKELQAGPWAEMNAALSTANIQNYSIFMREPENLLFGYWEYVGSNFVTDMAKLGELPVTKRWLTLTDPCQEPLTSTAKGEWWSMMPQIFHLD